MKLQCPQAPKSGGHLIHGASYTRKNTVHLAVPYVSPCRIPPTSCAGLLGHRGVDPGRSPLSRHPGAPRSVQWLQPVSPHDQPERKIVGGCFPFLCSELRVLRCISPSSLSKSSLWPMLLATSFMHSPSGSPSLSASLSCPSVLLHGFTSFYIIKG